MGGGPIIKVPKAVDIEAHQYPRQWKKGMYMCWGAMALLGFQLSRYSLMHKQKTMGMGEYMDWNNRHAPHRIRY
jgi:hypothetical protein